MLRREDNETPEQEVGMWLDKKGIPRERYRDLQDCDKVVLHNLVCTPTHHTTARERRDLYKALVLPGIAGREADRLGLIPRDDALEKFFTPMAPSETLSYLEKF